MGSKKVPASRTKSHQVLLNGADGLEFPTEIDCGIVLVVRKSSILRIAGRVSYLRRAPISVKLRAALGLG
ncbi:hypothetical protein [Geminisphaera colitermitum]|uniref:hypothetical protein n=1 Tax=Geminisphaera colitermitum TaxID=1148786 RepID=UPI000196544B|nr:hypothetical protein [Geminisphaera colitermitum]